MLFVPNLHAFTRAYLYLYYPPNSAPAHKALCKKDGVFKIINKQSHSKIYLFIYICKIK